MAITNVWEKKTDMGYYAHVSTNQSFGGCTIFSKDGLLEYGIDFVAVRNRNYVVIYNEECMPVENLTYELYLIKKQRKKFGWD